MSLAAERYQFVGGYIIEEFWWAGRMVVYVDNRRSQMSFDVAIDWAKENPKEGSWGK